MSDNESPKRCAIYVRISKDREKDAAAVTRQEAMCREAAERRGWRVVAPSKKDKDGIQHEIYSDNSISASRYEKRVRPAYRMMLDDARDGRFDVIVCTALDRLTRQPRELEDIIDLIQTTGTQVVTLQGDIDLTTSQGRVMAGVLAAFSRGEVEAKSQRQLDANRDRRKDREFYRGAVPRGYVRGTVKVVTYEDGSFTVHEMKEDVTGDYEILTKALVPDPDVEKHIRRGFSMVLKGKPLRAIAEDWDAAGFKPPRAERWSLTSVLKLLSSPTFAAIQTFYGDEVGPGKWVPYVSPEEHREVLKSLASRRKSHGVRQPQQEYLLTGILKCSCEGHRHMTGTTAYKGLRYYRCSGRNSGVCSRSVVLEQTHKEIIGYVLGELVTINPDDLIPEETRQRKAELGSELVRIAASRKRHLANPKLSEDSLGELLERNDTAHAAAIEEVRKLESEDLLASLINYVLPWSQRPKEIMESFGASKDSVRARFNELGMVQQRIVIDALGYYKLSEGKRGKWTTVEIYPRNPVTGEISQFSTKEDPYAADV